MTQKRSSANSSKAANGNGATKTNKNEKFKPIVFGKPNDRKKLVILNYYKRFVITLNEIIDSLNIVLFNEDHPFEIDFLFALLQKENMKEKRKAIYAKYVELYNIKITGIDTSQLIEKEMLDIEIPGELIKSMENAESEILRYTIDQIGFAYPLMKLYKQRGDKSPGLFEVTEELQKQLDQHMKVQTKTPEQNMIYECLKGITNNLNQLHNMGVLHINKLEQFMDMTIDTDRFSKVAPFSVSAHLFHRNIIGREHRIKYNSNDPVENLFE